MPSPPGHVTQLLVAWDHGDRNALENLVELRFFGGLRIEETGEAMGLSPTTVKRQLLSSLDREATPCALPLGLNWKRSSTRPSCSRRSTGLPSRRCAAPAASIWKRKSTPCSAHSTAQRGLRSAANDTAAAVEGRPASRLVRSAGRAGRRWHGRGVSRARVDTRTGLTVSPPSRMFPTKFATNPNLAQYAVTADGQRFLGIECTTSSNSFTFLINRLPPRAASATFVH